jgi:phage-related protein
MKPLDWIGSSHKDLLALPRSAQKLFGFALSMAQEGRKHDAAKVLKGFGGAGVLEVRTGRFIP